MFINKKRLCYALIYDQGCSFAFPQLKIGFGQLVFVESTFLDNQYTKCKMNQSKSKNLAEFIFANKKFVKNYEDQYFFKQI